MICTAGTGTGMIVHHEYASDMGEDRNSQGWHSLGDKSKGLSGRVLDCQDPEHQAVKGLWYHSPIEGCGNGHGSEEGVGERGIGLSGRSLASTGMRYGDGECLASGKECGDDGFGETTSHSEVACGDRSDQSQCGFFLWSRDISEGGFSGRWGKSAQGGQSGVRGMGLAVGVVVGAVGIATIRSLSLSALGAIL